MRIRCFLLCAIFCASIDAYAYEVGTHSRITQQSYIDSVIDNNDGGKQFLSNYGIYPDDFASPFRNRYFDVSGGTVVMREVQKKRAMDNMPDGVSLESVKGWLMRGSIREDDVCTIVWSPDHCDYGFEVRVLNHFFDPVNNAPLTISGISSGEKAPDWATGSTDAFASPNTEDTGRENHFSIFDAREAMWRALTGTDKSGGKDIRPANSAITMEDTLKAYWATAFRALGDVLHLIQDMSQPQHTRNDAHLFQQGLGKKVFESYTEKRAIASDQPGGAATINCFDGGIKTIPGLNFAGYPKVKFNAYSEYFSSHPGSSSGVNTGKGLADYSNRGFFSAGTNIGNTSYVYPSVNTGNYQKFYTSNNNSCVPIGARFIGKEVLWGPVYDRLFNGFFNVDSAPLTSRGVWMNASDLLLVSQIDAYGLTGENYQAMGDLLVPRAAAYGAGFLDYFFRGRLDIILPDEGIYGIIDHSVDHTVAGNLPWDTANNKVFGFEKIILKVKNVTQKIKDDVSDYPQQVGAGKLVAVAQYRHSPCYTRDLSGEANCDSGLILDQPLTLSTSAPLDITSLSDVIYEQKEFDFSADPIPVNATDLVIKVVFRGVLGTENDAIAAGVRNISEPTYISYRNSTDYFSLNSTFYPPLQITSDPLLLEQIDVNPVDGVPDVPIAPKDVPAGVIKIANVPGIVQTDVMHVEHYFRVAVLGDYGTVNVSHNIPTWENSNHDFQLRIVQWHVPSQNYVFSALAPLGGSGGELYYQNLVRLIRDPYPPGSTPASSDDYVDIPDPGPDPVTICFPESVCN